MYWVVFDPEVYPMDWSWWSGEAPASRVRERTGTAHEDAPQAADDESSADARKGDGES
jgi:hypothetical protein